MMGKGVCHKTNPRKWNFGSPTAYTNIATDYYDGHGVKQDLKEEKYHREGAAMEGHFTSRGCLHTIENNEGNMNRAMMHWIIAAEAGHNKSLQEVR